MAIFHRTKTNAFCELSLANEDHLPTTMVFCWSTPIVVSKLEIRQMEAEVNGQIDNCDLLYMTNSDNDFMYVRGFEETEALSKTICRPNSFAFRCHEGLNDEHIPIVMRALSRFQANLTNQSIGEMTMRQVRFKWKPPAWSKKSIKQTENCCIWTACDK